VIIFVAFLSLWFPPLQHIETAGAGISESEALNVAEMFGDEFLEFAEGRPEGDLKELAECFLSSRKLTYAGPLRDRLQSNRKDRRKGRRKTEEEVKKESKKWLDKISDRRNERREQRRAGMRLLIILLIVGCVVFVVLLSQVKSFFWGGR